MYALSLGFALMIRAAMGVGAWDVLHIGLNRTLGLTVGTWSVAVGLFTVAGVILMTRRLPTWGCVANMFFVGLFLDLNLWLLPEVHQLLMQVVFLLAGIVVSGFGGGMYIASEFGAGPRDWFMLELHARTGWSIRKVRTAMELTVLGLGWILGGPVSWGTIVISLTLGPVMQKAIHLWQAWMKYLLGRDARDEGINQGQVWIDHHDGVNQTIR